VFKPSSIKRVRKISDQQTHDQPKNLKTENQILVVDLDGTLIRSDMLLETFWSSFSIDWRAPFLAIWSLANGRAALKKRLAELSCIDVKLLPYNKEVLSYIECWRSRGGKTALVTASDQVLADQIANYLDVFNEAHGSNGTINLKGSEKAKFLAERFQDADLAYIGDSMADVSIWKRTSKSITVNAGPKLRKKVEALGTNFEHLTTQAPSIRTYFAALRPHQWLKNVLVFLPMLAAHAFTGTTIAESSLAFVSFCLVASSVYVLNDLLDLTPDRLHTRKCDRPFASGSVPISHGTLMVPLLFFLGLIIALFLEQSFLLAMIGYFVITTAYSLYLKRHSIIDICALASLYALRILAGGLATGISISVWLLAFSIFFFFALAAIKRQAELVDAAASNAGGSVGRGYTVEDLPLVTNIATASGFVSVLVFALYVNSPDVLIVYSNPYALWGICLVLLYWICRMLMVTHRGNMHDDPIVYAAKDPVSWSCFFLVLTFAIVGI